jgi:hypothetical protein
MTVSPPRPQGITILGVLAIVSGILGILGGLAAVGLGTFLAITMPGTAPALGVLGLTALAISIVTLVLGIGFLLLKSWAWPAGVILEGLSILNAILTVILVQDIVGAAISIVLSGVIVWYLDKAHVRAAFGAPATGFPIVGTSLDRYLPWKRGA